MTNSFRDFAGLDALLGSNQYRNILTYGNQISSSSILQTPTEQDFKLLSNFIGLSDLVYGNGSVGNSGPLPSNGSIIKVNEISYEVIDSANTQSGYQGLILFDQVSKSIIVVNRGTQTPSDWATDAEMAFDTTSNQWADAQALASEAVTKGAALGAINFYAVGHSLGGTLAQMQASYFGWTGYTFNAYGAGDIYARLGLSFAAELKYLIIGRCLT